jgi:hypothetical protein
MTKRPAGPIRRAPARLKGSRYIGFSQHKAEVVSRVGELQQPGVEGQRQQIRQLMPAGFPIEVCEDDLEIAAELP